jgi:hypothetical protein
MSKDLLDYFNKESAEQIASDLAIAIDRFRTAADYKEVGKIDFSFDVNKGKMVDSGSNTYFLFDLPKDTTAYGFLRAQFDREITPEEEEKLQEFTANVCNILSEKFAGVMSGVMRKIAFNNIRVEAIPMSNVKVYGIEFVDYSSFDESDKYTIRIAKLPGVPVNIQAVMSFIQQTKNQDGNKTASDIVEEERKKGNKIFEGVLNIEQGHKYLWDVSMSLFINYSYSEDFIKVQEKLSKNSQI